MRGLEGRTYIVTGAASGIGRATASRLLDEGASVMGADVAEAAAEAPGPAAEGARWSFTSCDVQDEAAVEALVGAAVGLGGAIDGLVNAAGVAMSGSERMPHCSAASMALARIRSRLTRPI